LSFEFVDGEINNGSSVIFGSIENKLYNSNYITKNFVNLPESITIFGTLVVLRDPIDFFECLLIKRK